MPPIDPAWAGKVEFYELLFGTWTSYIALVLLWQVALRRPLAEWRYVMLAFVGAGAFWVNHYFLRAPFWLTLINLYTVLFVTTWWLIGMRGAARGPVWTAAALLSSVAYGAAFIVMENVARTGVERYGMHEFCFMAMSYIGFVGVILWRGRTQTRMAMAGGGNAGV